MNSLSCALSGVAMRPRTQFLRVLAAVVEAFPGEVDGISVARPSLEDVFIQRTGHRFWEDAPALEKEKEKPWQP